MAKRFGAKGALFVAGLALAGRAYASGVPESYNADKDNSEKNTTIVVPSQREDYEGTPFQYDVNPDHVVSRTDEPQTEFLPVWVYDINGDGKIDDYERQKQAMSGPFNQAVNDLYKKEKEGYLVEIKKQETRINELESQLKELERSPPAPLEIKTYESEYNSLKSQYDSAIEELTDLRKIVSSLETEAKRVDDLHHRRTIEELNESVIEQEADKTEKEYHREIIKRANRLGERDFELDLPITPERQVVEVHSSADDSTNGHTFSDKYVVDSKATPETEQTQRVQNPSVHPGQFGFVAEGFAGKGFKGVGLGGSWEPLDELGFTLTGFIGGEKNRILNEVTTEPTPVGTYSHGITEQQELKIMGASFDLRTGKTLYGVLGGEVMNTTWIEKNTAESIGPDGEIRKSNQDYISQRQISGAIRAGLELILKNPGIGIGVIGKYNITTKKPSLGIRVSIRKPRNREKK